MERSLVHKFSELLEKQDKEKKEEKLREVSRAEKDLKRLLKYPEEFESLKTLWKTYASALNIKSDREKSGSAWTMAMLDDYISVNDMALTAPGRLDLPEEELQKIVERIDMSILAMRGIHMQPWTSFIANGGCSESDIRIILDAILLPLCVLHELTLRTEETIKYKDADLELPTNRYDYIMYCRDSPIGIVEAKHPGNVSTAKSVAQLLVQLLVLSVQQPGLFYFGVLSDGLHYIFAGISKNNVVFFTEKSADDRVFTDNDQLINTVTCDDNLKGIVGKISWLICLAKQSRKYERSIEELGCRLEKMDV